MKSNHRILFGSVPYLNATPLVSALEELSGERVLLAPPAELHEAMAKNQVSIALLPAVSYLEDPQLKIIPGSGIISHGPVQSVLAFHRGPSINLANSESIYLDPNSKTSHQLLKIILKQKYQRELNEINWSPNFEKAHSYLIIGDQALLHRQINPYFTDLGTEWDKLTGVPFVYACWMSKTEVEPETLSYLHSAKLMGKKNLAKISAEQEMIDPAIAFEYLSKSIQYHMGGPELIGLKLFLDWVAEIKEEAYDTSLKFITEARRADAVNL